jgi:hypothetical protein
MTRVIRNRAGFYLKQGGAWTAHFKEAEKFASLRAVIAKKDQLHLVRVDLVLVSRAVPSWCDVIFPLMDLRNW